MKQCTTVSTTAPKLNSISDFICTYCNMVHRNIYSVISVFAFSKRKTLIDPNFLVLFHEPGKGPSSCYF